MIEIKYENGGMSINTSEFFICGKIGVYKKLIAMSEKSDRIYETKTLEEWSGAIAEEIEEVRLKVENEVTAYDVELEALNQKYNPAWLLYERKIDMLKKLDDEKRRLRIKFNKSLKSLKNRSLKLEKFSKYLEDITGGTGI